MVKREFYGAYRRIWNYLTLTTLVLLIWLISVPTWNYMFSVIIQAEDPSAVTYILHVSVPFYVAYAYSVVLQAVLISVGLTRYVFYECLIVNFIYYGIVYGLYLAGVFEATLEFIILMFGIGLVTCLLIDVIFYLHSMRTSPKMIIPIRNGKPLGAMKAPFLLCEQCTLRKLSISCPSAPSSSTAWQSPCRCPSPPPLLCGNIISGLEMTHSSKR